MSDAEVLHRARGTLREAGLRGSFLVRDLDSGEELGIDPDVVFPLASLVKVPLAVATQERIERGELDGAAPVRVVPGALTTPGPAGASRFRHPATIAVDDLLHLAVCISDNTAADALFGLTPPAAVTAELHRIGVEGIAVRHLVRELTDTPAELFGPARVHLAHSLAIGATTSGHGHPVAQLDVSRANSGSARALVDLLQQLWRPTAVRPGTALRVRELLHQNLIRHRLAPDLATDSARWASKTGTLLNLRHEAGVVEHTGGPTFAVAALTESRVSAAVQPGAEAAMAHVARMLRDRLRS